MAVSLSVSGLSGVVWRWVRIPASRPLFLLSLENGWKIGREKNDEHQDEKPGQEARVPVHQTDEEHGGEPRASDVKRAHHHGHSSFTM
jgi:hypothetical protein